MSLEWMTPEETGEKWGIKAQRVQTLCSNGRIQGIMRLGRSWIIPKDTKKPIDGRTKIAKSNKGCWFLDPFSILLNAVMLL